MKTALILIDFINDFSFLRGKELADRALVAARATAKLRDRVQRDGHPVIYANDNFGRWRSDFKQVLARCSAPNSRGREIAKLLQPEERDHFVLKPKNSAFYASPLEPLLKYLRVRRLILTGVAIDMCVHFTANDAYLRDYELIIPSDCVAGLSNAIERESLAFFQRVLKARTAASGSLRLA